MNLIQFQNTLKNPEPPQDLSIELKALWYVKKNRWNEAHELIQDVESTNGYWIHAFLHRIEGDISNAKYWYQQAEKTLPNESIETELEYLIDFFLPKQR